MALIAGLVFAAPALAEPFDVTASPVSSFGIISSTETFGPMSWRGGLSLSSTAEKFGGLSGLALSENCETLLAVSDAGLWFRAKLVYEGNMLVGITGGELASMLDSAGNPLRGRPWTDAEALTAAGRGRYLVGFERNTRIAVYDMARDGLAARYQLLKFPQDLAAGPENNELEALGTYNGDHIAISESNLDASGNIRAWMWSGKRTIAFSIKRFADYQVTDLAVLPDGGILILERSFDSLPSMSIRRFAIATVAEGGTVEPEQLFSGLAPIYAIDNMEGIAVCERDGETRVTLLSDNNFNSSMQRTLLLQFSYKP